MWGVAGGKEKEKKKKKKKKRGERGKKPPTRQSGNAPTGSRHPRTKYASAKDKTPKGSSSS